MCVCVCLSVLFSWLNKGKEEKDHIHIGNWAHRMRDGTSEIHIHKHTCSAPLTVHTGKIKYLFHVKLLLYIINNSTSAFRIFCFCSGDFPIRIFIRSLYVAQLCPIIITKWCRIFFFSSFVFPSFFSSLLFWSLLLTFQMRFLRCGNSIRWWLNLFD